MNSARLQIEELAGIASWARSGDLTGKHEPKFYGEALQTLLQGSDDSNYHQHQEHELHDGLAGLIHEKGACFLHSLDFNAGLRFLTTRLRVGK